MVERFYLLTALLQNISSNGITHPMISMPPVYAKTINQNPNTKNKQIYMYNILPRSHIDLVFGFKSPPQGPKIKIN